jgi:hypothetical protein
MQSAFTVSCLSVVAGLLLLIPLRSAAQTSDSTGTAIRPQGTLVTLGTGIVTPNFEFGSFGRLPLPLILSAEHHLSSAVSVYANGFSSFHVGNSSYDQHWKLSVGYYGFDTGIRYYYNQEKRRQKGRPTGPFIGNYIGLQTSSVFRPNAYFNDYRYSSLTAVWGMQRRLGKYSWLNTYAGAGIRRDADHYYLPQFNNNRYNLHLELGVKVSLGSRLGR